MTTVNKSIYPPPPPFYQLYTCPPPPPPVPATAPSSATPAESSPLATAAAAALSHLPVDIFTPPPPLHEPFLKFGELQPAGYESHELPPDVPPLYVRRADAPDTADSAAAAAATAAATTADTTAAAQASSYPDVVDYSLSLRLLNRQYLATYLRLLSSLVPLPGSAQAAASPEANPADHLERHLKELSEIGANFALLLTRLRPHQANQTLLQVMMKQIERRKKKRARVLRAVDEARTFLAAHGVVYPEGSTDIEPATSTHATTAAGLTAHAANGVKLEAQQMEVDEGATKRDDTYSTASQSPLDHLRAMLDELPDDE